MSYGPSGALQFQYHKNSGGQGIFWQKEKPKNEPKKFGYKSKGVSIPLRKPDEREAIEALLAEKEQEKRKFNKENKDFIRNNKNRYRPREDVKSSSGSHITPGTVTLTQEQLAALLASLGQSSNTGGDNPLKISFDASANKIEVEKYESGGSGDEADGADIRGYKKPSRQDDRYNDAGNDDESVGISAFLEGHVERKPRHKVHEKDREDNRLIKKTDNEDNKENFRREEVKKYREEPRPKVSQQGPSQRLSAPEPPSETKKSWEMAKKEAGVSHVPDNVPWKHLTVGERKRLQWAREKADASEDYNPWGRPGAGAPPQQKPDEGVSSNTETVTRQEVVEKPRTTNQETDKKQKKEDLAYEIAKLQLEIREAEERKKEREERANNPKKSREQQREDSIAQQINAMREERQKAAADERKKVTYDKVHKAQKKKEEEELKLETNNDKNQQEDTAHLSKKEIERRKWLAELETQREEQRMRKQAEKEKDRNGIHDQWADRFVYHKTVENISPRKEQSYREEVPLGKASEAQIEVNAPPAAMRSAMVVGAGTLNENRYVDKKREEQQRWREELEKQREEQRLAKVAQKERDRQEDGTWADRYPSDHKKLQQPNHVPQYVAPPASSLPPTEAQRTTSAPGLTEPVRTSNSESDVASTFLRGQGAFVDPVTRREQEEKRRVYLDHQNEIKRQIEEKERLKREEKERKAREDMEEERKFQLEKDRQKQQLEMEQQKNKQREEMRQHQITALKTAMDDAQERAQEERNHKRLQHLQTKGHDVSHLKATYEASTPGRKDYDHSVIPGLGMDSSREPARGPSPPPAQQISHRREDELPVNRHRVGQSYTKEPYVENRILTPNLYRNERTSYDQDSPRREFGTQTLELRDLQAILKSLPDEVQIEYKMKVEEALKEKMQRDSSRDRQEVSREKQGPTRKVHVKSADNVTKGRRAPGDNPRPPRKPVQKEPEPEVKKRQMKVNERPAWGSKQKKAVVKNSEKDPFYHQNKQEKEERRAKRERQLQYLQDLNKERIISHSKNRSQNRDHSPEDAGIVNERGRRPAPARKVKRNEDTSTDTQCDDSTPNILSLINDKDRDYRDQLPRGRNASPQIPTVRHRAKQVDTDSDPYHYANNYLLNTQADTRYGDINIAPAADGDFLPFMRTTEILDPSKADEPMAISREASRMQRARVLYHETHNPASKGRPLNVYQDREREAAIKSSNNVALTKASQDPILNPSLVTDHPTARQDRILQQLSSLKQTLMQRKNELENYMEPEEE